MRECKASKTPAALNLKKRRVSAGELLSEEDA